MNRLITKLLIFFLLTSFISMAQSKKAQDKKAIKSMCGCYEVGFNFAETFSYSPDSGYQASKVQHSKGLEWVELVKDSENKIVMQHILIVGNAAKPRIVKHWRQDWLYENTGLYMYDVNNKWTFVKKAKKDIAGQWTQKAFQVDDGPRYEGSSTWVHVDGKSYWENITDAPLPRREHTKRNDYNVTVRRNRHEITKDGWVHDQYNDKVIREKGKKDIILAQEKGYNTYTKVDDSKCNPARNWWKENSAMWALVRNYWHTVYAKERDLHLKLKVDNKQLYEYLFNLNVAASDKEIEKIIAGFVE